RKEDEVERVRGRPGEDVRRYVLDVPGHDTTGILRNGFRGRINSHNSGGGPGQHRGPESGSAGELQYSAGRDRGNQSGANLINLGEPRVTMLGTAIVTALPQKPLVIFGGACAVIRDLGLKDASVFHSQFSRRDAGLRQVSRRVVGQRA